MGIVTYHRDIIQRSPEWYAIKLGKLGGSMVKDILDVSKKMKLKSADPVLTKVSRIIAEIETGFSCDSDYQSESMEWGIETEAEALESIQDGTIETIGGITNSDYKYFWLSPDGISFINKIGYEVKCFSSQEFAKVVILNKIPSKHLAQVLSYYIADETLNEVHFICYDPRFNKKTKHVIKTKREDYAEHLLNMSESLKQFDKLVDKYLPLFK